MKLLWSAVLCSVAAAGFVAAAETGGKTGVESRTSMEMFSSKINHVYEFQEGDINYVAYVVTWRGHDVVVQPLLSRPGEKKYAVGDTVRCLMHEFYRPGPAVSTKAQVTFTIAPPALLTRHELSGPTENALDRAPPRDLWHSLDEGTDRAIENAKTNREDPSAMSQPVVTPRK